MDEQIEELARRSPNFGFLLPHEPLLVLYGAGAEASVYTDTNGSLVKCRQFIEVLTTDLTARTGVAVRGSDLFHRIHALADAGVITRPLADALHDVRRAGNEAVHNHLADRRQALECLNKCFQLGLLLHRAIGNDDRRVIAFVPPQPPTQVPASEVARLQGLLDRYKQDLADARLTVEGKANLLTAEAEARAQAESELALAVSERETLAAQVAAMESRIAEMQAKFQARMEAAPKVSVPARQAIIDRARKPEPLNEAQARRTIDRMLRDSGWIVQDMDELAPTAALGVAVREFPFSAGRSDYALYVAGKLVGVIEAKREGTTLTAVEAQTAGYAKALPKQFSLAAWRRDEPLPFSYESTGVETRFTNRLDPEPRSRQVFTFHQPKTIAAWMAKADERPEAPTFRAQVRRLPPLIESGLRPAQIDAITGVERSLSEDHPRTLVQMATGAGKTYTAVTQAYRLIKHADAQRILFLVDRNNLGDQAAAEFRNYVAPDDGRKLEELYNVQRLASGTVLDSTQVVVTTIQRLYMALNGERLPSEDDDPQVDDFVPESPVDTQYNQALPPETFDLIVVDECHRSIYGKWRAVLDYFDAPIVGLTATPTAQTLGFFDQNLASEYTYEQAVADGVNVDFDVYRIKTKLSEQGGTIAAIEEDGTRTVVPKRDRRTRIQRYEELEEDFTYSAEQIGRSVLAEDQIRLVLKTFKDKVLPETFPDRTTVPKTLIFAKSDEHADDIVQLVREVFGKGNDFAAKITYKSRAEGNDPKQLLQLFRTSPELRIAVTVDMIATGTDVRPLEVVFFMRGVQSAVYFEQMKGRGARTVDETEFQQVNPDKSAKRKDRFLIVDAVGVTDSPLCDARPLDRERSLSLSELLRRAANLSINESETATLASRLARLDQQIGDDHRDELARVGNGVSLRDLVRRLVNAVDPDQLIQADASGDPNAIQQRLHDAVTPLTNNPELRQRILDIRREYDTTIDEINRDELLNARGLPREERARTAVASFRQYIAEHQEQIVIQQLLHGSGRISYSDLQDLASQIKRVPNVYSVDFLWKSYQELGEAPPLGEADDALTNLVSMLRYALGLDAEIRPYRSQIEDRYRDWLARQQANGVTFTSDQCWYLDHIVDVIATSATVTPDDLQGIPFDQRGGVYGLIQAFGDRAATLIDELNEELTA